MEGKETMVTFETLDEMDLAFEKARKKALAFNPSIFVMETGHYRVSSSKPNKFYDVYCGRKEILEGYRKGEFLFFVACNCRAGLEGKACYHGSRAIIKHQLIKSEEVAKRHRSEMDNAFYSKTEVESEKVKGYRL